MILVKYPIPEDILYKAITINLKYNINQPAQISLGITKLVGGPIWKPIQINNESVNKKIVSTWLLNTSDNPKLNWLSGSYEGVILSVSKSDPNKNLVLIIYGMYLE